MSVSAPVSVAASAGCGSGTVRASAKPETAKTTTGISVSGRTVQLARCRSPNPAARVPSGAYVRGIRSLRPASPCSVNRVLRACIPASSASVTTTPTVVTEERVTSV